MTTFADDTNRSGTGTWQRQGSLIDTALPESRLFLEKSARGNTKHPQAGKYTRFLPYATFIALICTVLLMNAVMALRNLWFPEALLTQLGSWPVAPSLILFPGWPVNPPIPQFRGPSPYNLLLSWGTLTMLLGTFVAVFLVYLFALRSLPARISQRFIIRSTLVLGLLFVLIPVVTSSDIYSYIAYARIGVIHGLNPLTTVPQAISTDPVYKYVSWRDQPSAYGPTWTLLTSFFQEILALCGLGAYILPMVLVLRLWGLAMHVCSVCLVWSIGGSLQRLHGIVSAKKRLLATLAFAWNPLLLLEACTNAHNDTTLLLLILLAIWFLVRVQLGNDVLVSTGFAGRLIWRLHPSARSWLRYLVPAILLGLGTSLKVNLVLLVPGLFFYQWLQEPSQPIAQRLKRVSISVIVYITVIVALYAPFWQGGAVLNVFQTNPSTYRSINTLPYTLSHLYDSSMAALGFPLARPIGSPAEHFFHTLSLGFFVLLYLGLCWQAWRSPGFMRSIHGLVRWMAITWLFYCSIGSPWFWPWYMITFFGLYALMEASKPAHIYIEEAFIAPVGAPASLTRLFKRFQDKLLQPNVIRLFALSMLFVYGFATWGPAHSVAPGLPGFQWSYLTGAVAWFVPLFGLKTVRKAGTLKYAPLPSTEVLEKYS